MKFLLILLISFPILANIQDAPQNFPTNGKQAVFVDMTKIVSDIKFHLSKRQALVTTILEFNQPVIGAPLFDLVPDVIKAEIDGFPVDVREINSPDRDTTYRMVNKTLKPGMHQLQITHLIDTNIRFNTDYVELAFWMSDLKDRRYLERYLPCNLEYDQYELELNLSFTSQDIARHDIFTNGFIKEITPNNYQIKFPSYFSASSFYLHMTKKDKYHVKRTHFISIDERRIPLTIYSRVKRNVTDAEKRARKVLVELESMLGAWGHPSLTIYIAGMGGMEHSGATITSIWALGHELMHSYFARGVMPKRGNAGWIDEAIASWRDDGYQARRTPGFSSTSMGNHSIYRRYTDQKAYKQGADFMEYLNHRLESQGGLKSFLKATYSSHLHRTISTKNLQNLLYNFSGEDFSKEFKTYILGGKGLQKREQVIENPYHPQKTTAEELELL